MTLDDLKARISRPGVAPYQSLYFLCPACQKHEVGVEIWGGQAGKHFVGNKDSAGNPVATKLWHAEQGPYRDFATLSITPSIDAGGSERHGCKGWHGFVTNGEIK